MTRVRVGASGTWAPESSTGDQGWHLGPPASFRAVSGSHRLISRPCSLWVGLVGMELATAVWVLSAGRVVRLGLRAVLGYPGVTTAQVFGTQ